MKEVSIENALKEIDLEILTKNIFGAMADNINISNESLVEVVDNLMTKKHPVSERNMMIFLYYRSGKTTYRELGEVFDVTGVRVRQISEHVLKIFKHPKVGRGLYEKV